MKRAKISVIGSGNIGATTAYLCALKGLGDVVLLDIIEGIPEGKGLDIFESLPVEGIDCRVAGTNSYADTEGSDVVVITAGVARKPGMSRDDLIHINKTIITDITGQVMTYSPDCILIVVTNPLDVMVTLAHRLSGLPGHKVIGMAGVLDSARFRCFIADELGVSVESVSALVLGGHGDTMVPMVRLANVGGIPLETLISAERLEAIVRRTRDGGAEIVNYLKTGSAYYAPASSIVEMVEAIVKDRKKVLPCAAYLQGEYGVKDLFIGVPVKLGAGGVEEIYEISLNKKEKEAFTKTVEQVRALVKKV
ncbi:MAG: malate dehydrogenase [Syntrophaceae bacterium]